MHFTLVYDPTNWVPRGAMLSQTVQQRLDDRRLLVAHLTYQPGMRAPMIERVGLYALREDHWDLAYEIPPLTFTVAPTTVRVIGQ